MRFLTGVLAMSLFACSNSDSNFADVMRDAEACADQRTGHLYETIGAENVSDEMLHKIVDECMAQASATHAR